MDNAPTRCCPEINRVSGLVGAVEGTLGDLDDEGGVGESQDLEVGGVL